MVRVMITVHWSEVRVTGQRSRVTGQVPLVRVTSQGLLVKGHWSGQGSRVMGQASVVKGHDQGSEVRSLLRGQGSLVSGQGSEFRGHWSVALDRVKGLC